MVFMIDSGKSGFKKEYLELMRKRRGDSKIYAKHQFIGLELAKVLDDMSRKALYIKLAKENDGERLLTLAKDVASKIGVKNKGAYFMRVFFKNKRK